MTYKLPIDVVDSELRDALTAGESTMSRRSAVSLGVSGANGSMRLAYFQARKTETIAKVQTTTGSTAQSGATLCRVGIFSVATNGDLTLVGSIADAHTTLWIATSTMYESTLSASFTKTRGLWYAAGVLSVGASTAPLFLGHNALPGSVASAAPRLCGVVTGLSDLPSSVSAGSITDSGHMPYIALVP